MKANQLDSKTKFANPAFILDSIAQLIKEGDFSSATDFISVYISKTSSQEEFAKKIGTTRQTLHRFLCNENVTINILMSTLDQIHNDLLDGEKNNRSLLETESIQG